MGWIASAILILLTACFALAARLDLLRQRQAEPPGNRSVLTVLLGDSRRLFANQFFVEADRYFHNGYYPSIFDQSAAPEASHLTELRSDRAGSGSSERTADFLGQPRDWIDAFGRHFYPSAHAHADETGDTREIMPWLRLSAALDPHRIQTYVVAAYWLRTRLGKVGEAEQFLHEGWRQNPDSYAILIELGRLYFENRKDFDRARNLWSLALKKWTEQESAKAEPDTLAFLELTARLARLEEATGHYSNAIQYLQLLQQRSPSARAIQKQINALREKLPAPAPQVPPARTTR